MLHKLQIDVDNAVGEVRRRRGAGDGDEEGMDGDDGDSVNLNGRPQEPDFMYEYTPDGAYREDGLDIEDGEDGAEAVEYDEGELYVQPTIQPTAEGLPGRLGQPQIYHDSQSLERLVEARALLTNNFPVQHAPVVKPHEARGHSIPAKTIYLYPDVDNGPMSGSRSGVGLPIRMTVHPRRYRNLEALLSDSTDRMPGLTYGARAIYSPRSGAQIRDIDELVHQGHYICSDRLDRPRLFNYQTEPGQYLRTVNPSERMAPRGDWLVVKSPSTGRRNYNIASRTEKAKRSASEENRGGTRMSRRQQALAWRTQDEEEDLSNFRRRNEHEARITDAGEQIEESRRRVRQNNRDWLSLTRKGANTQVSIITR
ncbi:unnamed protein product [Protopolystoma xenopodis]|uniref:Doublecortin domain-containing protein n=1 Tax=Protopolystoma xenopodis TaxID=117903 RepID=A0A3S5BVS0_9PLAT|nr:unnamed protein product [Protopolystoma xenopodis]